MSSDSDNLDGWFLIRLSLHDPILPLRIETNKMGNLKVIAAHIHEFLKRYNELDLSVFDKYLD